MSDENGMVMPGPSRRTWRSESALAAGEVVVG